MITLNNKELALANTLGALKASAGSHSPSIATIKRLLPDLKINIDACFLSNPYATDLFISTLESTLIERGGLRALLEFYPSQNATIAQNLAPALGVEAKHIFIGNGAIEVIQAVLHRFVRKNLIVPIPTFSSYYEFIQPDTQVLFYPLAKERDYMLDSGDLIAFAKKQGAKNLLLINPNNPNGGYITYENLVSLLQELAYMETIIIDESFLHFAYENENLTFISYTELFKQFPNVVLIKSMSKDFGIAGLRAGYGIMHEEKVKALLHNGYLWNINGLSEFFFMLFSDKSFMQRYEIVRKSYIKHSQDFFAKLHSIQGIKTYESKANFALVELTDGSKSWDLCMKLLANYGIYARTCNDKIGLEGEFVRIASRSEQENLQIIAALKELYNA